MTGYAREELLAAHEQFIDNEDSLIAGDDIGVGDSGTSSTPRVDGDKEPPVIVKVGGAKAVNPKKAISDVVHLVANGTNVVVVHGDSTAIDEALEELGEGLTYVGSSSGVPGHFIDEHTMEVFSMVIPGKLSTDLTAPFREAGVDALGLSGADDGLLTGPHKPTVYVVEGGKEKIKHGNYSGKITPASATLLEALLDGGYTPTVTVPMFTNDDMPVNADADCAAAVIADAFGAKLVVLTNVKDVYAGPDDESTLVEMADTSEGSSALESTVEGFTTKKVIAAEEALDGGAVEVVVADANLGDPIVTVLSGSSTHVTPDALVGAKGAE